ncbi:MAG: DUF637 domain-containing protein, partial [Pseudomonas farsensis]|uniref:DUF637 domain-containing protein n=1 Tax=Pseudomonas farsensis TaxID=2745492 RepID=UPI003C7A60C9
TSVWAAATATTAAGWANVAATAVISSAAGSAAVSTINNKGNLELVLKDVTSKDAVRGYLVTGITAGLTAGVYDSWVGTETGAPGVVPDTAPVAPVGGLASLEGMGRFAGNQLLQNGTSTVLDRALGGDSSFSDALRSSLANSFAAAGFNLIGDVSSPDRWDIKNGSVSKVAMHAVMGGLAAEAAGGDFRTGALAAGVNEALVDTLAKQYADMDDTKRKGLLTMNSQVIGVLVASTQGDDAKNLQTGAWVAANSTQYNYLTHQKMDEVKACLAGDTCSTQAQKEKAINDAEALSKMLDKEMKSLCTVAPSSDACRNAMTTAIKYVAMQDAWDYMNSDVGRSSGVTFDQLYNGKDAKDVFPLYVNSIDNRADFFGASDKYEFNLGSGAKWFYGAELVSRASLTGLGADGHGSSLSFLAGAVTLTGYHAPKIYEWREAAGAALIEAGFDNFKSLYNNGADPVQWDINQLKNEQRVLQPVHEKYLKDRTWFVNRSKDMTNSDNGLVKGALQDYQTMPGGIEILNYDSRIKYGCKLLNYSSGQGCVP